MKTKEEIMDAEPITQCLIGVTKIAVQSVMQEYADQEKQALKEKIIADVRQVNLLDETFQGALEAIIRKS